MALKICSAESILRSDGDSLLHMGELTVCGVADREAVISEDAMTSAGLLSVSHSKGGVRHRVQADIQTIRQILSGYGSPRSILKELIQNAEDARATRIDMFLVPGDPESHHPLLTGPGLVVANDGAFTAEDRDAISQIDLGTKATEERAIGRFGRGLKSLFAWSEAFFIIARTDPDLGWTEPNIIDFFNPWYGWRHQEWDEKFEIFFPELVARAEQYAGDAYQKPWLTLWFPLRRDHLSIASSLQDSILPNFPGDDAAFFQKLGQDFRALVPSLVSLRNIQRIRLLDLVSSRQNSIEFSFSSESERIPAPDDATTALKCVRGGISVAESGGCDSWVKYCGVAGRLPDAQVAEFKDSDLWPRVARLSSIDSETSAPVKGEPHFATLISSEPNVDRDAAGVLEVRWCVFFPVGRPPQGVSSVPLTRIRKSVTVNLHGFFFLDSERLRVDGLEDGFNRNGAETNAVCIGWNQILASDGPLGRLPEALDFFADQEQLDGLECHDLARAIRQTWVWKTFANEICKFRNWTPRWIHGEEKWEAIFAESSIRLIPKPDEPRELLKHIPSLGPLSETEAIVATENHGALPGLWSRNPTRWPEPLVLRLLSGVQLGPEDRSSALWINEFLNDLDNLSPAILGCIADLPLLSAQEARTKRRLRISPREWKRWTEERRLFRTDTETTRWTSLLCEALPNWSCFLVNDSPGWLHEPVLPTCNSVCAAQVVLGSIQMGEFPARKALLEALLTETRSDPLITSAMRFLMHADPSRSGDIDSLLFLPATQPEQRIWVRVLDVVLGTESAVDSWRRLDDEWSVVLSPQQQRELKVSTIDAKGLWTEMIGRSESVNELGFPVDRWSMDDIGTVVSGLYQAGQALQQDGTLRLLRRMRVHTLCGQSRDRVSIGGDDGGLSERFVLNRAGFDQDLPPEIKPLWQAFLSEMSVVEEFPSESYAWTVQRALFGGKNPDGSQYFAELDWNFVVRRCLEGINPHLRAPLIMEALGRGDQSVRGLGQKLKTTKWIPLAGRGSIAPQDVIHIEGLEDDLDRLLDAERDGLAGIKALDDAIRSHAGFATLRNYLPRIDHSLEALALWLGEKPAWHLGLTRTCRLSELQPILQQVEEFADLPIAALLVKLQSIRHRGLEEGIDRLIEQYILPAVLKSFDYQKGGHERLASLLRRLQGRSDRSAFDAYLSQACKDSQIGTILPTVSLVNQQGHWIPASELIWPSMNLSGRAQVCADHAKILAPLLHAEDMVQGQFTAGDTDRAERGHQLLQEPDFDLEAEKLEEFLRPFRRGNTGENLLAAFVAVLGENQRILALLDELLHHGIALNREDFLQLLLGAHAAVLVPSLRSGHFLLDLVRGGRTTARTVTGGEITVECTEEITSLIVGDPSDLWYRYSYRARRDTECHRLRLRWIEDPEALENAVAAFAATIETILLKAYCNGVVSLCPSNLREVLSGIANAGQTDLKRSREYLLDMAEARLRELGAKHVPELNSILRTFAEARNARVDSSLLASNAPARSRQRSEDAVSLSNTAKQGLLALLETDQRNATQLALVEAVKRKMRDYQYSLDSFAYELFQNADDATAELEEMQGGAESKARHFALELDSRSGVVEVFHWGRPINRYEYSGFNQGLTRGYDQDLQKMLTLNFSDKGVDGLNQPGLVTGRFGLGFKSVFFLTQEPEVISGRLAFSVRGGFFPVPLSPIVAEDLRCKAETLGHSDYTPTGIRLSRAQEVDAEELTQTIERFVEIAPLLPIFARAIQLVTITNNGATTTWRNVQAKLSERVVVSEVGRYRFLCFCCHLASDDRPATVLFQLSGAGISPLHDGWTGLWITTPTAERSELRFALNAPMKPDAGRQRLAVNNAENRTIAGDIAQLWGEALIELFDKTMSTWDEVAQTLQLHAEVTPTSWWSQFWQETTRTAPINEWSGVQNGGQVLVWIAWARSHGAMCKLIEDRAAIPTGLPAEYSRLLKLQDVDFSVEGLLADFANGCFAEVFTWHSTRSAFPPGHTVDSRVAAYLRQARLPVDIQPVTLESALRAAVGSECRGDYATAERIGTFFIRCKAVFESSSPYVLEVHQLAVLLKQIAFEAIDGSYRRAEELVSHRAATGVIESDEPLRAAFAPPSAVLSPVYSDSALSFFAKARGQLNAPTTLLADWAREASGDRLNSVFKYLCRGGLGQELADELERSWLESKRGCPEWQDLSLEEKNEIERKFLRGYHWQLPIFSSDLVHAPEPRQEMDAWTAFELVSKWWQAERLQWIAWYEERTYPVGFPGDLLWPGDDQWDGDAQPSAQNRWLLLFVHAALVPLGFNTIGRDRGFSQFLVSNRWLDVLENVQKEPEGLLDSLDEYLDSYTQYLEHHFQMRQFVSFYAVAQNLESLLLSIKETERSETGQNFRLALSPRANPALTGTGIDAPPLGTMLGIGSCQLFRELYRIGRLSNSIGHRFAFLPIRKVRRLCMQLFGISEGPSAIETSEVIFDSLAGLGARSGLDPTFNLCFDLPLQILAEDPDLRSKVLKMSFDLNLEEESDAAPSGEA
jgi:hypothetical protein